MINYIFYRLKIILLIPAFIIVIFGINLFIDANNDTDNKEQTTIGNMRKAPTRSHRIKLLDEIEAALNGFNLIMPNSVPDEIKWVVEEKNADKY